MTTLSTWRNTERKKFRRRRRRRGAVTTTAVYGENVRVKTTINIGGRAREVLLTGADSAKNHTTGAEDRREYSTPSASRRSAAAAIYRQASLHQRHRAAEAQEHGRYWAYSPPGKVTPLHLKPLKKGFGCRHFSF